MKSKFTVSGMSCAACSARVEKSVGKLLCVKEVSVNLLTGSMVVEYKEKGAYPYGGICTNYIELLPIHLKNVINME